MPGIFNQKYFNDAVFGKYLETVPRVKQNALLQSGVLRTRSDIAPMFDEQTGSNYAWVPMSGRIGGDALNYDGSTDITADGIDTYMQGMIVVGRAKAWEEKDFSADITGGKDFMEDIAGQVGNYWDDVDELTIQKVLAGIFGSAMPASHTLDITSETTKTVGPTTLNTAIQQACGANKNIFSLAIMHSSVSTGLENLKILEYAKYTDAEGIQKEVALGTWNGRTVLVDDDVPTEDGGDGTTKYTTYVLGQGAIDTVNCGAKVPSEMWRDPKTAGGKDMLITRQRKIFAPRGFSFIQPSTAIVSPTDTQLATAARWQLVKSTSGTAYDHKAIPIARIVSLG